MKFRKIKISHLSILRLLSPSLPPCLLDKRFPPLSPFNCFLFIVRLGKCARCQNEIKRWPLVGPWGQCHAPWLRRFSGPSQISSTHRSIIHLAILSKLQPLDHLSLSLSLSLSHHHHFTFFFFFVFPAFSFFFFQILNSLNL